MKIYRGVINADIEADQRVRNDYRIAKAKAAMGETYLLHPANRVQRKDAIADERTPALYLQQFGRALRAQVAMPGSIALLRI